MNSEGSIASWNTSRSSGPPWLGSGSPGGVTGSFSNSWMSCAFSKASSKSSVHNGASKWSLLDSLGFSSPSEATLTVLNLLGIHFLGLVISKTSMPGLRGSMAFKSSSVIGRISNPINAPKSWKGRWTTSLSSNLWVPHCPGPFLCLVATESRM